MDNEIKKYCENCKFYSVLGCQSTLICTNGDKLWAADVQPFRWIKCEESLPVYDGLVLVADKNNNIRLGIFTETGWLSQFGTPRIPRPKAWAKIPELPEPIKG